ncbi:putative uncharacterized protein [Clostridium sp. CAG:590]|nr:putative uncharacterized protein [Clostridium sp. CAG:590]
MQFHFNSWLVYFYFYCIFGWVFESTYVSLRTHKLTNRGFMKGPWLPLYGSGAILVLLVTLPYADHPVGVYFAGMIAATILEYITGVVMVKLFKVRYWDYSYKKIQFQGHICLSSSLAWGGLSLLMVYVIHPPIVKFIAMWNENVVNILTFIVTICMAYDFANAFREAMDLRALIIQAEELKKRMEEVVAEKREAFAETVEERREQFAQSVAESKEQLAESRERLAESLDERKEKFAETVSETRERIAESVAESKEQLAVRQQQWEKETAERQQRREEQAAERKEKRQETAAARKERIERSLAELTNASENLKKRMEEHSGQLLLHNPGASYFGMKEESGEIRRRLLERRKK